MTYRHMIFRLVVFVYCLVVIFLLPGLCAFQWYNFARNNFNTKKNDSSTNDKIEWGSEFEENDTTTILLETSTNPENITAVLQTITNRASTALTESTVEQQSSTVISKILKTANEDQFESENGERHRRQAADQTVTSTSTSINNTTATIGQSNDDYSQSEIDDSPSVEDDQRLNATNITVPPSDGSDIFALALGLHYVTFIGTAVILLVFILIERICELYYYPDMEILLAVTYALVCFVTLIVVSGYIIISTGLIHYPPLWLLYRCKWYLVYPFTEVILLLCLIAESCIIYSAIKACRPF